MARLRGEPPPFDPLASGSRFGIRWPAVLVAAATLLAGLVLLVGLFLGFVGVSQGQYLILVKKTGRPLDSRMLLAAGPEYQGVQAEIVREGYHFFNPYTYTWIGPKEATAIHDGKVGVVVRKFGAQPPEGQIAQTDDQRGVLREPLLPGRHYINEFGYSVAEQPMVAVPQGFRGVVTLLEGPEPKDATALVVQKGERGTQPFTLPPGTYPEYSNPWLYKVVAADMRSQKLELSGENSIRVTSRDGFDIDVSGVVEWARTEANLPESYVKYVDEDDPTGGLTNIQEKLVLPFVRSLARIHGAQHDSVEYITGTPRVRVQNRVQEELAKACEAEGIEVKSFVFSSAVPPPEVREQYSRRELARRQIDQYGAEIAREIGLPQVEGGTPRLDETGQPAMDPLGRPIIEGGTPQVDAQGKPLYAGGRLEQIIQLHEKSRAEALGGVRQSVAADVRAAEQRSQIHVTQANQRLEVARLKLGAAEDKARAAVSQGRAAAEVKVMRNKAEVAGIETNVASFGSGQAYADYLLRLKFAPAVQSIWSNTEGSFADWLTEMTRGRSPESKVQSPESKTKTP